MALLITQIIELIVFPPGLFIILLLLAMVLFQRLRRLKIALIGLVGLIYILSIPLSGQYLFQMLEQQEALDAKQIALNKADVIIILAGGIKSYQQEYHAPDVADFTLQRLRYGARLQKLTGLPVIVTGGIKRGGWSEAQLMARVLRLEYGLKSTIYVEQQSHNTFQNAEFSKDIIRHQKFLRPYLVTHAFHMNRAVAAFAQQGIEVIPAPMGFYHQTMRYRWSDFLPTSKAIRKNYLGLHELVGQYWYQLYY